MEEVTLRDSLPLDSLARESLAPDFRSLDSLPQLKSSNQNCGCERTDSFQIAPNLFSSVRFAWAGVRYAFFTQPNFRLHLAIASIALGLSVYLRLSMIEMSIICLTIGAVLVMELLNTALEAVVDLSVGQTYHLLAKIAKDCAAGAVLISAFVALSVAACLLLPPLAIKVIASLK
jgi:diacylglycerol kinase (ATP)